tara:strand:+ start:27291 stop:27473 length:183 start_codon:yes stop_codon:yes gene_type:complete
MATQKEKDEAKKKAAAKRKAAAKGTRGNKGSNLKTGLTGRKASKQKSSRVLGKPALRKTR